MPLTKTNLELTDSEVADLRVGIKEYVDVRIKALEDAVRIANANLNNVWKE
jgi:hypothetical protein